VKSVQSRPEGTAERLVVFDTRERTHIHLLLRLRTPFF
jgi:hypothetical protein